MNITNIVLAFQLVSASAGAATLTLSVTNFGVRPNSRENAVPGVKKALEACRQAERAVLVFPKGRYDFWAQHSDEIEYFESNSKDTVFESVNLYTAAGLGFLGQPGSGINDRLLCAFGDHHWAPVTLEAEGGSFTFVDRVFLRIGRDRVEVSGDLRALKLKVSGQPTLVLNRKPTTAPVENGTLQFTHHR